MPQLLVIGRKLSLVIRIGLQREIEATANS